MRIAVLVKVAMDANLMKVEASGDVSMRQTAMAIAEYDRNAVQTALDLRDKLSGQVIALSASTWGMSSDRKKDYEGALREALAMGVDEAHLVLDDSFTGVPLDTATALAALSRSLGGFDIYVTGEGSSDMVSGQMAPMLATILGLPAFTYVKRIEMEGGGPIRLTRDLEDRLETVGASPPFVMSVTGESGKPKLPTLMQIRRAFSKSLKFYSLADIGASPSGRARRTALRALVQKRKNVYIDGSKPDEAASKLLAALAEEGVVRA